jgi:hypothetical protein
VTASHRVTAKRQKQKANPKAKRLKLRLPRKLEPTDFAEIAAINETFCGHSLPLVSVAQCERAGLLR